MPGSPRQAIRRRMSENLDYRLYHGYTSLMKTAISLPDALYEEAEQTARTMGIPRSQLFARAVAEYIRRHRREGITARLNEVYQGTDDRDTPGVRTEASLDSLRELTRNDTW